MRCTSLRRHVTGHGDVRSKTRRILSRIVEATSQSWVPTVGSRRETKGFRGLLRLWAFELSVGVDVTANFS